MPPESKMSRMVGEGITCGIGMDRSGLGEREKFVCFNRSRFRIASRFLLFGIMLFLFPSIKNPAICGIQVSWYRWDYLPKLFGDAFYKA
jgi:hypothetical protein